MAKRIRLGQLGKELQSIVKEAATAEVEAVDRALRKTYIDRLGAVILSTPVDTGALQASWFLDPTVDYGKTANSSGQGAGYIAARINGEKVVGEKWYFYNNQPYAYRIEYDGYSNQAPTGMLRTNLLSFGRKLRKYWNQERAKL